MADTGASNAAGDNAGSSTATTTSLAYNIRWIQKTFTSRPITESLLAPERESGNISTNDYEAATNFLPGFHRHYPVRLSVPSYNTYAKHLSLAPWLYLCFPPHLCVPKSFLDKVAHLCIPDHCLFRWLHRRPLHDDVCACQLRSFD